MEPESRRDSEGVSPFALLPQPQLNRAGERSGAGPNKP
jgi:hypothetical protein